MTHPTPPYITPEMVEAMCQAYLRSSDERGTSLADDLTAALTAALAVQWRPIETAPRNRIGFLGYTAAGTQCIAFWDEHEHDWLTAIDHECVVLTHWQPLPPPPQEK